MLRSVFYCCPICGNILHTMGEAVISCCGVTLPPLEAEETDDAHLKELILRYIPYFDAIEDFCIKMKVPPTVTDREAILQSVKRALGMRDRYTILFYLRDLGKLDDYTVRATDLLLKSL